MWAKIPLNSGHHDKESTQHAAIFKQHSIDIIKVGADITISDHSDQHNWHIVTDSTDPDIVIVTETWLKPDKADGEIGETGRFACEYDIHRRDRPGKKTGGGVLIAVKKQYISSRQENLEADSEKENADMIWVKIPVEKCRTLYVSSFYKPKANDKESQKHLKT